MGESTVESLSEALVDLTEEAPIRVLHVDDETGSLKSAKHTAGQSKKRANMAREPNSL